MAGESPQLSMRAGPIDFLARAVRLEAGTTKNKDGREVTISNLAYELLKLCTPTAKRKTHSSITRRNGDAVRDFRGP